MQNRHPSPGDLRARMCIVYYRRKDPLIIHTPFPKHYVIMYKIHIYDAQYYEQCTCDALCARVRICRVITMQQPRDIYAPVHHEKLEKTIIHAIDNNLTIIE